MLELYYLAYILGFLRLFWISFTLWNRLFKGTEQCQPPANVSDPSQMLSVTSWLPLHQMNVDLHACVCLSASPKPPFLRPEHHNLVLNIKILSINTLHLKVWITTWSFIIIDKQTRWRDIEVSGSCGFSIGIKRTEPIHFALSYRICEQSHYGFYWTGW